MFLLKHKIMEKKCTAQNTVGTGTGSDATNYKGWIDMLTALDMVVGVIKDTWPMKMLAVLTAEVLFWKRWRMRT